MLIALLLFFAMLFITCDLVYDISRHKRMTQHVLWTLTEGEEGKRDGPTKRIWEHDFEISLNYLRDIAND